MNSDRFLKLGILGLFGALAIVGCKSQPQTGKEGQVAGGSTRVLSPAQNASSGGPASEPAFSAPEALRRKTSEYSEQMQSAMNEQPINDANIDPTRHDAALNNKNLPPGEAQARRDEQLGNGGLDQHGHAQTGDPARMHDPANGHGSEIASNSPANASDPSVIGHANTAAAVMPANPAVAPDTQIQPGSPLEQQLDHRIKDYPRDVSAHLDYQLLRFLLDDRVPDVSALSSLPTEDRELLSSLVDGLVNFRSALRQDNNMLLSRKVRPLIEMADRLRGQADLSIPTVALCTSVQTYGEYEPIEPARFAADQPHEVILYCEVDNFSSIQDEKQHWQTKLTEEASLYSDQGLPVLEDKAAQITDVSRHRRHDFFLVKKITLPSKLPIGRYLLKVTVVDQQMNRMAEASLPIVVAVGSRE